MILLSKKFQTLLLTIIFVVREINQVMKENLMPQGIVRRVEILGLFGRFDHTVPPSGVLHSPAILYGDNGVGKSTILNLVFHLMSAADDRGHRTALHKIPFDRAKVELSNGYTLTAQRSQEYVDDEILILAIELDGAVITEWRQSPSSRRHHYDLDARVYQEMAEKGLFRPSFLGDVFHESRTREQHDGIKRGEKEYLSLLEKCAPSIFYLNADRKLDSDSVADPSDEIEMRQLLNHRELKRIPDILQASRAVSLKQALATASRWVTRRAVKSANLGAENVHSVYENVINQVANNYRVGEIEVSEDELAQLGEDIDKIERDAKDFSKYELTSELSMNHFRRALSTGTNKARAISYSLITPYTKSLGGRLEAIRPEYDVLNKFVTVINEFLSRKSIYFSLTQGFFIRDDEGNLLEATQLSSGEQQLLLIFCYVLAARDRPSVFIVDEPEISLNVKWQRIMVDSLLQVAAGTDIQFIFASHSIELLTQHEDSVVAIG